jgi:hypothetical protein
MAAWLHAARLYDQRPEEGGNYPPEPSGHSTGLKIEKQKAGTLPGYFPKIHIQKQLVGRTLNRLAIGKEQRPRPLRDLGGRNGTKMGDSKR